MAIIVKTEKPEELISRIKELIDDGKIDTWEYDSDGDFTHNTPQWKNHAWIHPRVTSTGGEVIFNIIGRKTYNVTVAEYAVYHGRFAELLLKRFDSLISSLRITPLASNGDIIKAQAES